MATLSWADVLSIGRGVWDDVTRCRLAERDWGLALAIHPHVDGPQSVIVCADGLDGFLESASWRGAMEEPPSWTVPHEGALVTRGPLTVWRRPLPLIECRRLLERLLSLRVPSMKDVGGLGALSSQVYFRQGEFDHAFCIGTDWRAPENDAYRELLALVGPYLKPALRLYFELQ